MLRYMAKVYTIESFCLRKISGKSQCYKLCIRLQQGKRVFQYLVRLRDELCADALRSYISAERNEQLELIVRAIFKEHHLSYPIVKVSHSCADLHRLRKQSFVMKRFLGAYIAI